MSPHCDRFECTAVEWKRLTYAHVLIPLPGRHGFDLVSGRVRVPNGGLRPCAPAKGTDNYRPPIRPSSKVRFSDRLIQKQTVRNPPRFGHATRGMALSAAPEHIDLAGGRPALGELSLNAAISGHSIGRS